MYSKSKGSSFSNSEIAKNGTQQHLDSEEICPVSIVSIPPLPSKTSEMAKQLVMLAAYH